MAKWRTRAYEILGFPPGAYSYTWGKVELLTDLLSDLLDLARRALRDGDEPTLDRVFSYVEWAAAQLSADELQSAVDLAFFLPAFRDSELCALLWARLPEELFSERWQRLVGEPS